MAPSRRTRQSAASLPGLDFTRCMRLLCADIALRLPELAHIDVRRIAFAFSQTRKPVNHGLYATLTPLRFAEGRRTTQWRGRRYAAPRLLDRHGQELLYILTFYLPRFLNLDFSEKLATVLHELWHINPAFNGDIRRHRGRCFAHSASQKHYDAHMARLAQRYLTLGPSAPLLEFLREDFPQLRRRHGPIFGRKVPHPRLTPLDGTLPLADR